MSDLQGLQNAKPRKRGDMIDLDPTVCELLLEALEEEDTERSVELFLAARLVRIARERATRSSQRALSDTART